jgi:hypothetical protein
MRIVVDINCGEELYSDTCQACRFKIHGFFCIAFREILGLDHGRRTMLRSAGCIAAERSADGKDHGD